jgi:hypothetical protein
MKMKKELNSESISFSPDKIKLIVMEIKLHAKKIFFPLSKSMLRKDTDIAHKKDETRKIANSFKSAVFEKSANPSIGIPIKNAL